MSGLTTSIRLSNQLNLTPQLKEAISLLQYSSQQLNQQIQHHLETNPMLDHEDLVDEEPSESLSVSSYGGGEQEFPEIGHDTEHDLNSYLKWQLDLSRDLDPEEKVLAALIIENINDDGYLDKSIFEILTDNDIDLEHLQVALKTLSVIQKFDPVGIGATSLKNCMQLQIEALIDPMQEKTLLLQIIDRHLVNIANNNIKNITVDLKIKEEYLQALISVIKNLDPKPGRKFGDQNIDYITPDVFVELSSNTLKVRLNHSVLTKLKINSSYNSLMKQVSNQSDLKYCREQLNEARWILKCIATRNETLLTVSKLICELQSEFMKKGPEFIKPMVISDLTKKTELHASTISRITSNKYIQTPFGLYELKYFFSSNTEAKDGKKTSSTLIKNVIKNLINTEDPTTPLSDDKISKILAEHSIKCARRTVTKYREAMNIDSSSERKIK